MFSIKIMSKDLVNKETVHQPIYELCCWQRLNDADCRGKWCNPATATPNAERVIASNAPTASLLNPNPLSLYGLNVTMEKYKDNNYDLQKTVFK